MRLKLYLEVVFAVLFALIVNTIVYFSFSNVYSSASINYTSFVSQYTTGIYQYRFLSTFLFLKIHAFISYLDVDLPFNLFLWGESGEENMILSFYVLNSLFIGLFSGGVIYVLSSLKQRERLLIMGLLIFSIAISQFVLVPYDVSSYFFILLFYSTFSRYLKSNKTKDIVLSAVILIISTINRESSALLISMAGALLYFHAGINKKTILIILTFVVAFLLTYLGMRMYFGSFSTNDGNLLIQNLTNPKNYLGILFSSVFLVFSLLISSKKAVYIIILFHLLSLPYIFMCFYTGILYEIRLYIPLFISSVLIGGKEIVDNRIGYSRNKITNF